SGQKKRPRRRVPPGPCRDGLRRSVFVDRRSAFVVGRTTPGEEVDLVGDDLAAVALGPVLVRPLGVVNAPFDRHQLARGAVFGDVLAQPVEACDAVELAVLGGKSVLVLVGLAVLAGRPVGHDRDRADGGAAGGGAGFGIASDAADEDNEIGHGSSPDPQVRVHSRLRTKRKKRPPACRTGRRSSPYGKRETDSGGAGSRARSIAPKAGTGFRPPAMRKIVPGNTAGAVSGCDGKEPLQGKVREQAGNGVRTIGSRPTQGS